MKTLMASTTIFFTILFFLAFGIACGYAVIAAILRAFGHKPKRSEATPATAVIAAGR
jgi:Na+/melibiose symporter-like transporter